jgi:phosphohistidine phosphatase
MRLYLMRHGEASWDAASDAERPLTERGQWLTQQVAEAGLMADKPQQLIASPYRRAQQTSDIITSVIGDCRRSISDLITPEGNPQQVLDWLYQYCQQQPNLQRLLLVSHNPFISELISYLVMGGPRTGDSPLPVMMPSTLVSLSSEVMAAGCFELDGYYPNPNSAY